MRLARSSHCYYHILHHASHFLLSSPQTPARRRGCPGVSLECCGLPNRPSHGVHPHAQVPGSFPWFVPPLPCREGELVLGCPLCSICWSLSPEATGTTLIPLKSFEPVPIICPVRHMPNLVGAAAAVLAVLFGRRVRLTALVSLLALRSSVSGGCPIQSHRLCLGPCDGGREPLVMFGSLQVCGSLAVSV